MATLSTAAQNAALQAIVDLLNVGTTFPSPAMSFFNTSVAFMFNGAIGSGNIWEVVSGTMQLIDSPIDLTLTTGGTVINNALGFRVSTRNNVIALVLNPATELSLLTLSALAGQKLRISAFDITIG